MDITGLDKDRVLMALYNSARQMNYAEQCEVHPNDRRYDPAPMTLCEARHIIAARQKFWYLNGRVVRVFLTKDIINTRNYDEANGKGAAEFAILDEFTRPGA